MARRSRRRPDRTPADPRARSHWLTRFLILRLLGAVYLVAFLVAADQNRALLGERGLLPARAWLERVEAAHPSRWEALREAPTLFWFDSSDRAIDGVAWAGAGLSCLVLMGFANTPLLLALWTLYLSIVTVGQTWYAFGWESQLLETGFLAAFLCPLLDPRPFPRTAPAPPAIWVQRWLVFRIMLGAGLIKVRGDACWRDLSCLCFHYETQPLPNPLSPYLHFLPSWFHGLGCAFNHFVELGAPFFLLGPPAMRRAAGALFLIFQAMLIASGNLSFLNWLTIVPALACLDDAVWARLVPARLAARAERAAAAAVPSRTQRAAGWALLVLVGALSVQPALNLLSSRQYMNFAFNRLRLVNTYGAFGSIGKERFEIVLEGTADEYADEEAEWRPYEFVAKPGDPDRPLPLVSPFHHRLDWQIWFAAMSTPEWQPWAVHLVWKLLHGDPGAISLLAGDPFPDRPPEFIRAELYVYRFTRPGEEARGPWRRVHVGSWLPPLCRDDPELVEFLRTHGWLEE